ncbi:DUF5343 domain-containing protein [bacterium]|nr:MAG: DUF5343 domain-containing protein [bacterium]
MNDTKPSENKQKTSPPYLSVGKLAQLFGLISTRNFQEIQPGELTHYGYGESDGYVAVTSLRFLGLLNSKNQVQEVAKKLHLKGDARTEAIAELVKSAYAKLLERMPTAYSLPADELHNEFIVTYGITPRLARTAVPAFLWLAEEGGLKEPSGTISKSQETKRSVPKAATKIPVKKAKKQIEPSHDSHGALNFEFKGGVRLIIPNSGHQLSAAIAQGELKMISEEINKFVEKHLTTKE